MKRLSCRSFLLFRNQNGIMLSSARKWRRIFENGWRENKKTYCKPGNWSLIFIISSLVFSFLYSIATAQQHTVSPLHQRVSTRPDNKVYDTKAWSFNTGAPVRATPLVSGDYLYAGNAAGQFFALNKKTGKIKWTWQGTAAIHSSAIIDKDKLFFSDNKQTVFALDMHTGRQLWTFSMGPKQDYPWRYDYYYSSPVLYDSQLLIGGDDGYFYALDPLSGKLKWKFKCAGIIRSTAAYYKDNLFFGDTEATLYALDSKTGALRWRYKINGDTMQNEKYGFDRRAITSSPVVAVTKTGGKLLFGARDGYLYCIDVNNGKDIWKADHRVSWVISTVAVKDSMVVTGTSDGRFVQALDIETGREIWKQRTPLAVWASPLIVGSHVYTGGFDGQFTCWDLATGQRVSQYKTAMKLLSSPVWNDNRIYIGGDDGNLYAFSGRDINHKPPADLQRYVYYETGINVYFRGNSDLMIRNYLRGNGYKVIGSDSLAWFLSLNPASSVIVFATAYFPPSVTVNGANSILRNFLDAGGKIILPGINPLIYKIDEKTKQPVDYNRHASDTILSLDYGPGDTRSFMGDLVSFPTIEGRKLGLPDFWTTSLFIAAKHVDLVLGKNENGDVSAFLKKYRQGGQLVQLWMDPDRPDRLDAIVKAAEGLFK